MLPDGTAGVIDAACARLSFPKNTVFGVTMTTTPASLSQMLVTRDDVEEATTKALESRALLERKQGEMAWAMNIWERDVLEAQRCLGAFVESTGPEPAAVFATRLREASGPIVSRSVVLTLQGDPKLLSSGPVPTDH